MRIATADIRPGKLFLGQGAKPSVARVLSVQDGVLRFEASGRPDGATFYLAARTLRAQDRGLIEGCLRNDPAKLLPPVTHESTTTGGLAHLDGAIAMAGHAPGTAAADFSPARDLLLTWMSIPVHPETMPPTPPPDRLKRLLV